MRSLFFSLLLLASSVTFSQQWRDVGGGVDQPVRCFFLDTMNNLLYVGGQFDNAGSLPAHKLAIWNGTNWSVAGDNSDFLGNAGSIESITLLNNDIIVGGLFDSIGSVPAKNIARWDGSQWNSMGSGLEGGGVFSLQVFNGEIYAGGNFMRSGNDTLSYISKWNGATWVPVVDGLDYQVSTMCVFNGLLVIGGWFNSTIGNWVPANSVVGFDGINWVSFDGGFNTATFSLKVIDDSLFAVGNFSSSFTNLHYITKWDGQSWLPFPYPSGGTQPWVTDILKYQDYLYVSGYFTNPSDVAKFNGSGYDSVGNTNGYVKRMIEYKGELYIGGAFNSINSIPILSIARFNNLNQIENPTRNLKNVIAYPNPVSCTDEFFIKPSGNDPIWPLNLQLFDSKGSLLKSYSINTFRQSLKLPEDCNSGIYFLIGSDYLNESSYLINLITY